MKKIVLLVALSLCTALNAAEIKEQITVAAEPRSNEPQLDPLVTQMEPHPLAPYKLVVNYEAYQLSKTAKREDFEEMIKEITPDIHGDVEIVIRHLGVNLVRVHRGGFFLEGFFAGDTLEQLHIMTPYQYMTWKVGKDDMDFPDLKVWQDYVKKVRGTYTLAFDSEKYVSTEKWAYLGNSTRWYEQRATHHYVFKGPGGVLKAFSEYQWVGLLPKSGEKVWLLSDGLNYSTVTKDKSGMWTLDDYQDARWLKRKYEMLRAGK
jgi:hypothetical protein